MKLPKGANVAIIFASANDDETVFSCPRDFDPARPNVVKHLAFGGGIHLCAGISLARMEIKSAIREVMSRLKNIRLTVPEEELRYVPSLSSMPLERLPIRFELR